MTTTSAELRPGGGQNPPAPRSAEMARRDQAATAVFGVATGVIGALVAMFGRGTTFAVLVGLVTLCLTPGCALICWSSGQSCLRRVLAIFAASLTWTIVVTTVFALAQITSLGALLVAISGTGGVGSAVFLLRELFRHEQVTPEFDDPGQPAEFRPGLPESGYGRALADPGWPRDDRYPEYPQRSLYRGPEGGSFHLGRDLQPPNPGRGGPPGDSYPDGWRFRPAPDRADRTDPRVDRRTREDRQVEPEREPHRHMWLIGTLAVAIILFVVSVVHASGKPVGSWGLLPVLGIPFYLAMALTVVVLILALRSLRSAWLLAVIATCLLLVECNGTPFMFAATPYSSAVYKHFGVVDYIFHGGALNYPLDIYQQWPGFFAAGAALVRLSGREPFSYANWAQLFYSTFDAVVVFAIARKFSERRRIVPYITVVLFITAGWEGQFYYSPQATAFMLALLLQLFMLPLLETDRLRSPFRNWNWLSEPGIIEHDEHNAPRVYVFGVLALFLAIVVTHQLTPYMILGSLVCLWILGVLRDTLVVAGCAFLAFGYAALHLPAVDANSLLTGFNILNGAGTEGFKVATSQQELAGFFAKTIGLGIWGITAICVLSCGRRMGRLLVPTVLAAIPLSFLLISSYDGEGIYRAFLFSSPWCAVIIAKRLADIRRAPQLRLTVVAVWALFAALGSAQSQDFGQYPINLMPASELRAEAYFLDNAPAGAQLVGAEEDFPSRENRNYVLHAGNGSANDPDLEGIPSLSGNGLRDISMQDLSQVVERYGGNDAYFVVAPSMIEDNDYYRFFTPGTLQALVKNMKASSYFSLWYENDGTYIFKDYPQGDPAGSAGQGSA